MSHEFCLVSCKYTNYSKCNLIKKKVSSLPINNIKSHRNLIRHINMEAREKKIFPNKLPNSNVKRSFPATDDSICKEKPKKKKQKKKSKDNLTSTSSSFRPYTWFLAFPSKHAFSPLFFPK